MGGKSEGVHSAQYLTERALRADLDIHGFQSKNRVPLIFKIVLSSNII
jgi:hypothetical protein